MPNLSFFTQPSSAYTFVNQESQYSQFRPQWPITFAEISLKKLGICYELSSRTWSGLEGRSEPVVVSIGSGAGADAEAFLKIGCKVYAIEPNTAFRDLASSRLIPLYKDKFVCIDGDAHVLNLPSGLIVDLIVCAQSLHTFSSEILGKQGAEAKARGVWRKNLPDDEKDRISVWYYNLDLTVPAVAALDELLRLISPSYKKSKTTFLDPQLFEPKVFQHYIDAPDMFVSRALPVDCLELNKTQLMSWMMSYSFFPKAEDEKNDVLHGVSKWFDQYKNSKGMIELPYIGFISQGPLRRSLYIPSPLVPTCLAISPISVKGLQQSARLPFPEYVSSGLLSKL